ncbi:MAG: hypothetical protein Q8T09_17595 [Candidatus Melainabacteria bacterium]|nr:hypothetical protein [Candidatus Melainabacteria bacterium]
MTKTKRQYEGYKKPSNHSIVQASNPAILCLFLLTCVVITVTPFAGWWVAAQEKPSLQITAGEPSQTLSAELHQRAQDKIPDTEKILFVATPEPGHEGMTKIIFIPFAIVWTIFSLCWLAAAISGSIRSRNMAGWFFVLWGLPFVGIGLFMLVTPYFYYKRELHTIYAITDARALVFSNDEVRELVKFSDKHFGPIEAKSYSKDNKTKMDLLFRSSLDHESRGPTGGFWGIDKGEIAKAILEGKLKEK